MKKINNTLIIIICRQPIYQKKYHVDSFKNWCNICIVYVVVYQTFYCLVKLKLLSPIKNKQKQIRKKPFTHLTHEFVPYVQM